ncbi:MAG: hypothetical protein ABI405_13520 [Parafilimonas sp.]
MKLVFCLCYFLIFKAQLSMAQLTNFDKLINQLHFNVLTVDPDSSINDFLEKNVPTYAKKSKNGTWKAMAPTSDVSSFSYDIDTFSFTSHPYFHERFSRGSFLFLIKKESGKFSNLSGMYLSFDFESKDDAKHACNKLVDSFKLISTKQEVDYVGQMRILRFFDNDKNTIYQPVLIIERELKDSNAYQLIVGCDYVMKRFPDFDTFIK